MQSPLLFGILLALYPRRFRRRYGDEVLAAMQSRRDELYRDGRRPGRLASVLFRDLAFALPRVWLTYGPPRRSRVLSPSEETPAMSNLVADLRTVFRRLVHKPGLAMIAVLAMGLGIGLTTAMFSIINGVMLKGLPFDEPHEVVALNRVNLSEGPSRLIGRIHDYRDLVERQTTFEYLAGMESVPANVSPPGQDPEFLNAASVTAIHVYVAGNNPGARANVLARRGGTRGAAGSGCRVPILAGPAERGVRRGGQHVAGERRPDDGDRGDARGIRVPVQPATLAAAAGRHRRPRAQRRPQPLDGWALGGRGDDGPGAGRSRASSCVVSARSTRRPTRE